MDSDTFQQLALRTEADQTLILDRLKKLGPEAMRLDNAVRGLCANAGEVADVVQKYIEYGKPLDREHLLEECGDVLWRVAQALAAAGYTMTDAMGANVRKLAVRYPDKFTDDRAQYRNLEAERRAMTLPAVVEAARGGPAPTSPAPDPLGLRPKPDPFIDKEYQTPAGKCPKCRGTGLHRYPNFDDGTPNFSDSAPCGVCMGTGVPPTLGKVLEEGRRVYQDGHGFGHADQTEGTGEQPEDDGNQYKKAKE